MTTPPRARASELVDRLRTLEDPTWRPRPPVSEGEIAELEQNYEVRLPDDHRALLLHSNGGAVIGKHSVINLESVDQMSAHNLADDVQEFIPDFFVIGDDGGSAVYAYDRSGRLGRGEYAVYLVPMTTFDTDDAWFVGRNFAEMVTGILEGEAYHARPRLGSP